MTFHPGSFAHGPIHVPYKGSSENPRKELQEVVINIDSRDQLEISSEMVQVERDSHEDSWGEPKIAPLESAV